MGDSNIEWTEKVWNPVTGCTQISAGCRNCYAEKMSKRLKGMGQKKYQNGFKVMRHHDALDEPTKWKKPKRIFVCSMGDLFHKDVPFNFIHEVFDMMKQTEQHTFLILTKRPERMKECVTRISKLEALGWSMGFWSHVHLGVSVEDQASADERIPLLLQTPAVKRFVSYEPALGPVDFGRWLPARWECQGCGYRTNSDVGSCNGYCQDSTGASCNAVSCPSCGKHHYWSGSMASLHQIIMGGETGPGARPMHPDWARSVRDQCKEAGVPFFFKQWAKVKCKCYLNAKVASRVSKGQHGGYVCPIHDWGVPEKGYLLDDKEYRELI